jgi:glycosyltransferase involved in cell wall biosynthesis
LFIEMDVAQKTKQNASARARVVLVAYHYPPDPAVGSLRARNVALAMNEAGYDVHVVSTALPDVPADTRDGPIRVLRVANTRTLRDVLAAAKRLGGWRPWRKRAPQSHDEQSPTGAWKRPEKVSTIRRWIGALTWLPDDRQGFIVPATRAAGNLLGPSGNDILYTTAPPFSDFIVGLLLRTRRRCRWILDFRDPWTDPKKPWFVRAWLTDVIEEWAERRSLMLSDGVVTVTNAFAEVLKRRFGDRITPKLILVRNGIPQFISGNGSADRGVLRIVYAGTFYFGRDPKPFLRALAAARRRPEAAGRRLDVRLVGDCRHFNGEPIAPEIQRLGLSDVVTFIDWLPRAESVELMRSADVLLLLAQRQPLSVPQKLYEYLGMGKPILAIVDDHGESAQLLREIGGHLVVGQDDDAALERTLIEAMTAESVPRTVSPTEKAMATDAQMRLLTDWVDGLPRRDR